MNWFSDKMSTHFDDKREMLSSIFNSINLLIILLDENLKVIYANEYVKQYYKIPGENIIGTGFDELIYDDEGDGQFLIEAFNTHIEFQKDFYEFRSVVKNQQNLNSNNGNGSDENQNEAEQQEQGKIEWEARLIFKEGDNAKLSHVTCYGKDITNRVKLEKDIESMYVDLKLVNAELSNKNEELESKNQELAQSNGRNYFLQNIVRQYTPKSTWERAVMFSSKGLLEMPMEEIEVSIIFGDIQNFTKFSEKRSPTEVIKELNAIFKLITDKIYSFDGDIDKFIGDAFIAVFDNAEKSVDAAVEINRAIDDFNDERIMSGVEPLFLRMGINTGQVIRGDVGGQFRKDNTIIGDAVNITQRLESMSIPGQILIAESTYSYVKDKYIFSSPEELHLKGRKKPIKAFYYEGSPEDFIE